MNHYYSVITILRFIATGITLYYVYVAASISINQAFESSKAYTEMQELIRNAQNQALINCLKAVVGGVALYFAAPLLARIITLRTDTR